MVGGSAVDALVFLTRVLQPQQHSEDDPLPGAKTQAICSPSSPRCHAAARAPHRHTERQAQLCTRDTLTGSGGGAPVLQRRLLPGCNGI